MGYRPIPEELRSNIAEDLAVGCSFGEIAERYGVSFSTIRRIKNNSPEAPTPMENASEDNTVDNIDNTIVPDNEKNVKQDEYSPYESAVDDAVLERIEKIRDRITEMQFDISNYETELNVLEEFHLKYLEVQNNGT